MNLITDDSEDIFSTVKSTKRDMVIPKDSTVKVPCRVNFITTEVRTPVIFEPDEVSMWPTGLEMNESVHSLKSGSTSQVDI